jgi:phosphopantetheinyl transferase
MENISKIASTGRYAVTIHVPAHWNDHCFKGRAVVPAVMAMQLLSNWMQQQYPYLNPCHIKRARFEKFLILPQTNQPIEAFVDLENGSDGSVRAALLTKTKAKSANITRTKVHAQVYFVRPENRSVEPALDLAAILEGTCFKVDPIQLYQDLVPFGPSFRNIVKPLWLTFEGALAWIVAPDLPDNKTALPLGSPFVLDAAFHAACVWSQRFAHVVAFPIGIEERIVLKPTQPGQSYISRVFPIKIDDDVLIFDLWILDQEGAVLELLKGVKMRDVSGGRLRPPHWIQSEVNLARPDRLSPYCNKIVLAERDTLMPFAHKCLTAFEKRKTIGMGEKRRVDYIAARIALKRLSRKLSGDDYQTPAPKIATIKADNIRPKCLSTDGTRSFFCSVSHDHRFVLAVASNQPLGVDVEALSEKVLKGLHLFMNPAEMERIRSCRLDEIDASIRVWSIKESVAKAMQISLADAWQSTEVMTIGAQFSALKFKGRQTGQAVHQQFNHHLFTLVYWPDSKSDCKSDSQPDRKS